MTDPRRALVLFSGGQDSTVCLAWALSRYAHVETIGFDHAFTIDDFTYSSTAMIPEPSSSLLIVMGLTALVGWRHARGKVSLAQRA